MALIRAAGSGIRRVRGALWSTLLVVCVAHVPLAATAQGARLTALNALDAMGIRVSAEVVDLASQQVMATLDADQRLLPASVTKLYTAAAGLEQWGAAHTFTTRVLARGEVRGGVLHGDLILVGGGDPTLGHDDLAQLARQLQRRGLRRVTGEVQVDESLFGPIACVTEDRCEAGDASRYSYDAPLSAAGVDFSNVGVLVLPGDRPGAAPSVVLDPFDLPMLAVEARVKTVAAGKPARLHVSRVTQGGRDLVRVFGATAVDAGPAYRYRSVSDAARFSGEMFIASLRAAGIEVGTRTSLTTAPSEAPELARLDGLVLAEQLRQMLNYSNNYIADVLALDLLQAADTPPPLDLPSAGDRLAAFATEINRTSPFKTEATAPGPVLRSGSGLTVDNRLSASDLIALLDHMYRRAGDFPAFLGALNVPAQSPFKSLGEQGDEAWRTRVAVKTGSMNEPYPVYSLAGYFRFQDGHWGAFAVLINARPEGPGIDRHQALAAVRAALEEVLSTY